SDRGGRHPPEGEAGGAAGHLRRRLAADAEGGEADLRPVLRDAPAQQAEELRQGPARGRLARGGEQTGEGPAPTPEARPPRGGPGRREGGAPGGGVEGGNPRRR